MATKTELEEKAKELEEKVQTLESELEELRTNDALGNEQLAELRAQNESLTTAGEKLEAEILRLQEASKKKQSGLKKLPKDCVVLDGKVHEIEKSDRVDETARALGRNEIFEDQICVVLKHR